MASFRRRKLPDPGSRAPDFHLARLEGGQTPLAQIAADGPALLVFFKVTCPVCQMTLPYLDRIHAAGLPVYGVSQDDAADTRDFMREFGVGFPMLLDREEDNYPVSNAYEISSVPTMFLVERDGTIAQVIEGWRKADIERLGAMAGVAAIRPGDRVPEWKAG
ncbi:MAG TPA: TlpA disulfide reductase family protein [Verrucomicrobiae bacterium]|nr:TlpA disulfide reductase family protein [Verrucomicrobiae bacterium]